MIGCATREGRVPERPSRAARATIPDAGRLADAPAPHGPAPHGYHQGMSIDPIKAFETLDLRVGRIVRCREHEQARKPAYKLWLDFGGGPEGLGEKQSSARLMDLYSPEELTGRLGIAAVNLGSRRIGGFESEVLILGVPDAAGRVVLLEPERDAPLGAKVY